MKGMKGIAYIAHNFNKLIKYINNEYEEEMGKLEQIDYEKRRKIMKVNTLINKN
tara:strand:- start:521 stop:682 length:162 start_codon:yes stop_codon:yes gene_type:complete